MISAKRHLGPMLAAVVLCGLPGQADAASKENVYNACEQAIKKEFGDSPVEFGKFRRSDSRSYAFGELTLSDGSKTQIRCSMRYSGFLNLQFRGSDEPGKTWINQRPAAAIYVEPKDEKDAKKDTGSDATGKGATGGDTDGKDADGKDATKAADDGAGKDGTAKTSDGDAKDGAVRKSVGDARDGTAKKPGGDTRDATAKKSGGGGDETANADDDPVKPRFMKVPKQ